MKINRLRRVRDVLVALRDAGNGDRFRMDTFFGSVDRDDCDRNCNELSEVRPGERSPDPASCGTAACLAGWCQLLGAKTLAEADLEAPEFAEDWLELDSSEARHLFFGCWSERYGLSSDFLTDITLDETIEALGRMIAAKSVYA